MSAPPTGPAQAAPPNPRPEQAPAQGGSRIERFLGLLCGLIVYGMDMAEKLRQSAGTPTFTLLAKRFGTTDLAAIVHRIARGLRLAAALHERLEQRAARGRDITPPPLRLPSPRTSATSHPRAQRPQPEAAPDIAALPTPKEIAALLRRRPLGAVLVEICRDLGVAPGDLEPGLWKELSSTIIEFGGNLAAYVAGLINGVFHIPPRLRVATRPAKPRSSPSVPPALATGPP